MDTFTIWMLCIVGMMLLYGVFAVWFSVTGVKDTKKKGTPADDSPSAHKGKDAAD
jgi:hypothetical protein